MGKRSYGTLLCSEQRLQEINVDLAIIAKYLIVRNVLTNMVQDMQRYYCKNSIALYRNESQGIGYCWCWCWHVNDCIMLVRI